MSQTYFINGILYDKVCEEKMTEVEWSIGLFKGSKGKRESVLCTLRQPLIGLWHHHHANHKKNALTMMTFCS